jgi:hypothetical protein
MLSGGHKAHPYIRKGKTSAGTACDEPLGLERLDLSSSTSLGAERLSRVVTGPTKERKKIVGRVTVPAVKLVV